MTFPYDISVIVPIFNSETFIEPCMECLLGQTVGFPRMEVLLVNDDQLMAARIFAAGLRSSMRM